MEEQFDSPSPVRAFIQRTRTKAAIALGAFSPLERMAFIVGLGISALAVLMMIYSVNNHFMVAIPAEGGTLKEGVVGTPRYVNPLLSATDADRDLSVLMYRGLMKENADGDLVPDLAASYELSKDNLTYTFTLKDATFHDGEAITSADVAYTVTSAQDAQLKSPKRIEWQGVSVKTPDTKTVSFTLNAPYAPFLTSTTIGIIPKHIWSNIPYENWNYSDYNTKNIVGSGWYKIRNISENSSGIPTAYSLTRASQKDPNAPLIKNIELHFYPNETDMIAGFKSNEIDTLGGIDPENAQKLTDEGATLISAPLPRIFGLFFNQSQAKIFTEAAVRKAVNLAIDKEAIVRDVLHGYGTPTADPIPESTNLTAPEGTVAAGNIQAARTLLEKNGWKVGSDGIYQKDVSKKETLRLSFEIDTNDVPELKQAVDMIVINLRDAGIEARAKVYETGSLNQDIIRPRKFQALFFGQVVSSQSDLFAFWHSSQRTDPGLNIAGYANPNSDKLLEQGLQTLDEKRQREIYGKFVATISADMPAVFVYSPAYIYAVRENIPGITLGHINKPEDRFTTETTWYLDTEKVWKIFAKKFSATM